MKKIGLLILLAFAFAAGFAQTTFTATYSFGRVWDSNVTSLAYNGSPILGLNMGNIQKVNVDSWTTEYSFRAVKWPVGQNVGIDSDKYIGFNITAADGYKFTVTSIEFGISKSVPGARKAQWRGSHDDYGTALPGVTVCGGTTYCLTVDNGEITIPGRDADTYWGGNTLNLGSAYENITGTCGFRFYMYDAMAEAGDSGLYQELKINVTVTPPGSGTVYDVAPTSLTGLSCLEGNAPSYDDYRPIVVGGAGLTGYEVAVNSDANFKMTVDGSLQNSLEFTPDADGNLNQYIHVAMKEGLPVGDYDGTITIVYSKIEQGADPVYVYRYITLSGSVTEFHRPQYKVDFEGAVETKTLYDAGPVYLGELEWILDGVKIGTEPGDIISGTRSARLSGDSAKGKGCMAMKEFKICGAGEVSFEYRFLGNGTQESAWVVERLFDATGEEWTSIGTLSSGLTNFSRYLNTKNSVRIRIRRTTEGHDILLDSFIIKNFCDFYNGVEQRVGDYQITISGGNGNYDPEYVLDTVLPIEGLTGPYFHNCIKLIGGGTYTIETAILNINQEYTYWTAYKDGDNWVTLEMPDGTATFTVSQNSRSSAPSYISLELLIGSTEKQHENPPTTPVTLSHFSATVTAQNYVNLIWVSQTETNLMGYNVLRSADEDLSNARQICAMIEGTNTSEAQTYSYLDKELVEDGTYYYWLQSVDMDGSTGFHGPASVVFSITGDSGTPAIPTATQLEDAYPNPFNPNTTLRYQLKDAGNVKIDIYNQRGQLVRSFAQSHDAAGYYGILWDGRDSNGRALASGVYLYRMTSGKYSGVKKMVLQK